VEQKNAALENELKTLPLGRVFSFRQEFSGEFNRLLHSPIGSRVKINISDKYFPIFLKERDLSIAEAVIILRTTQKQESEESTEDDFANFSVSFNEATLAEFTRDPGLWGGLPFHVLDVSMFSEGIIGDYTLVVNNSGKLGPDSPEPSDMSAIDSNKLSDIYLFLRYGLKSEV
jgi:hypothetical protein